ncbi:MAG: peptide chain release factor 1 [Candidatus Fluviicola riflensis]|nr:MAG: aminoacyl-tRNA hydrolase [Candidatus Fluviicola riflensis]OGS79084.1 MAG: peptide chain release factor 1 [Candidatus Fluviicola riflensis]OGS86107.1 MAG: peptide chain release factor 1 [Fluviicola sp. RIFCSPHIGHO2_12_FULL_43_24]OGS86516.1 MAG: peptide chain release factor 1 [Fluviicola sp. RIFCSPHIGHO2_01_FULL_43_53]
MKTILPDLSSEITVKTSRSGGKGGQHVNKVSTKVELAFDLVNTQLLREEQKTLLLERLSGKLTKEGILLIVSQSERTQLGNKRVATNKLIELLEKNLIVDKKRKPTKVPKSVIEKRLIAKKRRGEIKKFRKPEL